jgi:hypothetical protein
MQVLDEKNKAHFNFVNSIHSEQTRQTYEYSLSKFLKYCEMDLDTFLRLSQQEISNIIINYLANKKISRQYKVVIFSAKTCLRNERRYLELEELAEIDRIKKGERIKRVKLVTNKLGYQYEYATNRTLSQDG